MLLMAIMVYSLYCNVRKSNLKVYFPLYNTSLSFSRITVGVQSVIVLWPTNVPFKKNLCPNYLLIKSYSAIFRVAFQQKGPIPKVHELRALSWRRDVGQVCMCVRVGARAVVYVYDEDVVVEAPTARKDSCAITRISKFCSAATRLCGCCCVC